MRIEPIWLPIIHEKYAILAGKRKSVKYISTDQEPVEITIADENEAPVALRIKVDENRELSFREPRPYRNLDGRLWRPMFGPRHVPLTFENCVSTSLENLRERLMFTTYQYRPKHLPRDNIFDVSPFQTGYKYEDCLDFSKTNTRHIDDDGEEKRVAARNRIQRHVALIGGQLHLEAPSPVIRCNHVVELDIDDKASSNRHLNTLMSFPIHHGEAAKAMAEKSGLKCDLDAILFIAPDVIEHGPPGYDRDLDRLALSEALIELCAPEIGFAEDKLIDAYQNLRTLTRYSRANGLDIHFESLSVTKDIFTSLALNSNMSNIKKYANMAILHDECENIYDDSTKNTLDF